MPAALVTLSIDCQNHDDNKSTFRALHAAGKHLHNMLPEQFEALHELNTLGLLSSMFS